MTNNKMRSDKARKITYWIATIWLALGMVSTGAVQLMKAKEGQGGLDMISQLGYPSYILLLLGFWKIAGVVAVLAPRLVLLKEWAYAGFFFLTTGAIFSHLAAGNSISSIMPALLLLILTILSWYFRPVNRKLISANA
jgi:hypothetical protein